MFVHLWCFVVHAEAGARLCRLSGGRGRRHLAAADRATWTRSTRRAAHRQDDEHWILLCGEGPNPCPCVFTLGSVWNYSPATKS